MSPPIAGSGAVSTAVRAFAAVFAAVAVGALACSVTGCKSRPPAPVGQSDRLPIYAPYARLGQVAAIDRIRLGRPPAPNARIDPTDIAVDHPDDPNRLFRITVRLNDGSVRAFDYQQLGDVRLGARVRVEDGRIFLYRD